MYNTMNNPSAHPSYSHYYLLSPSTLFFFLFLYILLFFFAHLVVFLHISLSFAHLIVFCTSYCFALFYFIAHFTLISPFLTICMPLCYVTYTFTFSHLADAFIQSDLQLGVHKAINLEEVNIQRKCQ